MAPVNPEGQTAQEVRRAALEEAALFVEKHQHPMWTRFAVAQTIRALASTPSPIQTQSTKDQRDFEKWSAALMEGAAYLERHGFVSAKAPSPAAALRALASTPSPAKQEQKIASAEGTASKLGAAPAALFKCDNCGAKYPPHHNGWDTERCIRCGHVTHQPAPASAQPDARDAEIARLKGLLRGVLQERPLDGQAPKPWHTLACPRCMIHASSTNPLCLRHEIAAALALPEPKK